MTTPADRGFLENTDIHNEITEAINRKIESLKSVQATRPHTGMPGYLYSAIIETLIDTCGDIWEIVNDVYARHYDADYADPDQ